MNLKTFVALILLVWSINSVVVADEAKEQNATNATEHHASNFFQISFLIDLKRD